MPHVLVKRGVLAAAHIRTARRIIYVRPNACSCMHPEYDSLWHLLQYYYASNYFISILHQSKYFPIRCPIKFMITTSEDEGRLLPWWCASCAWKGTWADGIHMCVTRPICVFSNGDFIAMDGVQWHLWQVRNSEPERQRYFIVCFWLRIMRWAFVLVLHINFTCDQYSIEMQHIR